MAILSTSNLLSSQRYDISDARRIESASRNDFDTLITSVVTGTSQGYIIRGFSIVTAGAIGSAANGLELQVDPGAVLSIDASVSGTIYQTPLGTPNQILNAAVNTAVIGSFAANSTNYVGLDYLRFANPATDVTKYIWNASANDEIPVIAPASQTLTFQIYVTTSVWAENVLPIAIVTTDSNGNVTSITDARWMLYSLETGGLNPNPSYVYPWSEGRTQPPVTTTSDSVNPFVGGDKQLDSLKAWMDAVMTGFLEIKGTPSWFSGGIGGGPIPTLQSLFQDLGNTVITGSGEISNGILPNSDPILVTTGNITASSNQMTNLGSVSSLVNGTYVFGTGIAAGTTILGGQYTFTVSSANATAGAVYSNNGQDFTVVSTIVSATTLVCNGTGSPLSSGTLTLVSGSGDSTITFSAYSATITLSQEATLNATGVGISFYSPSVITVPGQINWDDPIYIRVIGSYLTYELAANPSSADITLADDEVAYITLVREQPIIPNLIFSSGSSVVTSVGGVSWTAGLLAGDYIKIASDTSSGYYEILTVNTASTVTLAVNVSVNDNTGNGGAPAEYAFGSYLAVPTPSSNRDIYVAPREDVPVNGDVFWLFLREDNGGSPRVYIRFIAEELNNGQSVSVSGTTSQELLKYIGAATAATSSPQYVNALNPGSLPQISDFVFGAGSTISASQYFLINSSANARQYVVWFKVNGSGTQPVVPNVNGYIEVDILSTDTAAQVATAVQNSLASSPFGDFLATTGEEYIFATSPANATVGAVYSNNGQDFTVVDTISSGITLITTGTGAPAGGSSSLLNSAANFALLAYSTITNTGSSVINGDVGLTPGSSITPGAWTLNGTEFVDDATAVTAQNDATNAYNTLSVHSSTIIPSALDGQTLTAGYYSFSSGSASLAASGPGTLTLSGSATDVFVIITASTLTTGAGGVPTISLTGGALAQNVYWVIGSSATINSGYAGTFEGNIIAQASITNTLGGTVNGSLIALTGAVTISAAATSNAIPGSAGILTKVSGTGDSTISFSSFTEVSNVLVTNASSGAANNASNGNLSSPFTIYTIQQGTGQGNYVVQDGQSLTLAIKELDLAIGSLEASLDSPTYDEVVEIVASGATPPTSLNGPVANGTIITLPLNSREGNSLAKYTVGKGTLNVFLNGQFLDIESGAYSEVGAAGTPSNEIQILTLPGGGLVVGDELEFRIGVGGGGGGGIIGPEGPSGPTGPAGVPGKDALNGPIPISTKTSSYQMLLTDGFIKVDATSGNITITLPSAASASGKAYYIKRIDSSVNSVTVAAYGSDLIDGSSTFNPPYGLNMQYMSVSLVSDGTTWSVF